MDYKKHLWAMMVGAFRLLPATLVKQLCALSFDSRQSEKNADFQLKTLLEIQTRLRWYIDQQAIRYEDGIHPKHRLTDYHRFFVDRIRREDFVLDIGCGRGALAASMAGTGALITGIDIDSDNIKKALELFSSDKIEFLSGDVTRHLPEGNFSVLVLSNVLEHLENRPALLKSMVMRYSPRSLLVRVPMINRHWEVPLREELGLPYFSDPTHCIEYTEDSFLEEITSAGLDIQYSQICWGEIWAHLKPTDGTVAAVSG